MAPYPRARPSARPSNTPQSGRGPTTVPPPRRKRLNYSRTSIACGPCRRRKIRCIPAKHDPQNRCFDCIRLNKKCVYSVTHDGREVDAASRTHSPALQDGQEGIEKPDGDSGNNNGSSVSPGVQSVRGEDVSYPFLYNPMEEMTYPPAQNTGSSAREDNVNSIRRGMASVDAAHMQLQNMREVYNAYPAGQRISGMDNVCSAEQSTSGMDNAYSVGQRTSGMDNVYSAEQSTSGTDNPYSAEQSTNNASMAHNTIETDNAACSVAQDATEVDTTARPVAQNATEVDTTAPSMMQNMEPPSYPMVQNTVRMATPTRQSPWTMENPDQSTWEINNSSPVRDRAFTKEEIYHIFGLVA
ncbi:hypothetical protein Q9L58_008252 [Maublancomyces gigas]|uniref:Zn(2)-C6 fungal-type domain-containing protein n=1 Tax=Discina gigas TaxID=1032678 RepID=A0ABR3GB08_9PEZI